MMCFAVYDAFLQKYSRHSKLWMPHLLWWLDLFTVHACHCIWSLHCITFSLLFTTFFCSSRRLQWIGNSLLSQRVFANLLFQHFANHSNHHIGMSMIIEHGYNVYRVLNSLSVEAVNGLKSDTTESCLWLYPTYVYGLIKATLAESLLTITINHYSPKHMTYVAVLWFPFRADAFIRKKATLVEVMGVNTGSHSRYVWLLMRPICCIQQRALSANHFPIITSTNRLIENVKHVMSVWVKAHLWFTHLRFTFFAHCATMKTFNYN